MYKTNNQLEKSPKSETQNAEHRTQNAERRTQNAERRTQNTERRTPNAERIQKKTLLLSYQRFFFKNRISCWTTT